MGKKLISIILVTIFLIVAYQLFKNETVRSYHPQYPRGGGPDGLFFALVYHPPTLTQDGKPTVKVSNMRLYLPWDMRSNYDEICIDNIVTSINKRTDLTREVQEGLKVFGFDFNHSDWITPYREYYDLPACYKLDAYYIAGPNDEVAYYLDRKVGIDNLVIPMDYISDPFLYPYDAYTLRMYLEVTYSLYNDGEEIEYFYDEVPTHSIAIPNTAGWHVEPIPYFDPDIGFLPLPNNWEQMEALQLSRPWATKLSFPLLLLTLLFYIFLLGKVKTVEGFVGGGIGVFLGVFTLKQILLPAGTNIYTLIDFFIWVLSFVFFCLLISYFWRVYVKHDSYPIVDSQSTNPKKIGVKHGKSPYRFKIRKPK